MVKEVWKDIKNYEGHYQVSNYGRIKSVDKLVNSGLKNNKKVLKKGKILKLFKMSNGYLVVGLCNGETQKSKSVHRLVAEAFIPNLNNYKNINHKDENKENNNVSNLEWCDNLYNNIYGTWLDRIAKKLINNPKISKKVNQYDKQGNFIKQWSSTMEAQRNTGINNTHISACCLNKKNYKTAGGYVWKYVEEVINVKWWNFE